MPLYEFACRDCGGVTEKLISHSASDEEKEKQNCPECGGEAPRKVSLGSFELKGNWFKNKGTY